MKIVHERWKCIACGACAAVAPDFFVMSDKDGFADLTQAEQKDVSEGLLETRQVAEFAEGKDASEACPVECIHSVQDDGNCAAHARKCVD